MGVGEAVGRGNDEDGTKHDSMTEMTSFTPGRPKPSTNQLSSSPADYPN